MRARSALIRSISASPIGRRLLAATCYRRYSDSAGSRTAVKPPASFSFRAPSSIMLWTWSRMPWAYASCRFISFIWACIWATACCCWAISS